MWLKMGKERFGARSGAVADHQKFRSFGKKRTQDASGCPARTKDQDALASKRYLPASPKIAHQPHTVGVVGQESVSSDGKRIGCAGELCPVGGFVSKPQRRLLVR